MGKIAEVLENISKKVFIAEKWVLIVAVIAVTAVNFVNVIMRYVMNTSLMFCENLSLVLFMLMILIGGNIAVKTDSEIRIDVFRFKDVKKQNTFKLISDVCSILALVCLLIGSCNLVSHTAAHNQAVATLPLTYLQLYSLLIIGSVLMLFDHVVILFKHLTAIQTGIEEVEA